MSAMDNLTIREYTQNAISLMKRAHIVLPKAATVNIYHHRGLDKLSETGAMFINVVNRDYCKSIVVMLPGQVYPNHYHRIKTESFYGLDGTLCVTLEGENHYILPGEMLHIERGQDHAFSTEKGVVFEEISTMYVPNDSIYLDSEIAKAGYAIRRTTISADEWKEIIENA
ncbi:MAG: cupin domain-containing protein [Firmicutes bacterium]|nr:cupin domain-containing protein [Bacillota bacterium]